MIICSLRTEMTRERLRPCLAYAGGYKGEEEGHKVPKRTDIFISVVSFYISL